MGETPTIKLQAIIPASYWNIWYTVQLWITSIVTTSCVMNNMASQPADHVKPSW